MMDVSIAQPPAAQTRRSYLTFGLCALSALAFLAAHVLRPDLDPSWAPISEHALGDKGIVMKVAFLALSAACGTLLLAWRPTMKGWRGVVAQIGLALASLGFALAAIFPGDSVLVTPQVTTITGTVHGAGAVLADGLPIAALFSAWSLTRAGTAERRHAVLLWLGAGIALSGFVAVIIVMATFMPASGQLGPDVPIGWAGRYMMLTYVIWLAIAAFVQGHMGRRA